MKRILALAVAILFVFAAFVACDINEDEDENETKKTQNAEGESEIGGSNLNSSSNYIQREYVVECEYDENNDNTLILVNGNVFSKKIDGRAYVYDSSLDGKTVIIRKEDGNGNNKKYDYYAFRNENLTEIGSEFEDCKLSQNGASVVYVPDMDISGKFVPCELVLYSFSDAQKKTITNKALIGGGVAMSPDGKSVLFVEGDSEDDYAMMLWSNGEASKIKDNAKPALISDGAKYMYYTEYSENGDSVLCVMTDKNEEVKLGSDMSIYVSNVDNTEVLISSMTGGSDMNCYISVDGGDAVKIDSYRFSFVCPENTVGVKQLKKIYFVDTEKDSLCYLNEKLEVVEILEDVPYSGGSVIDKYGNVVYCRDKHSDLYRGTGSKAENFEKLAEDVEDLVITSDGSACYYIPDEDYGDTNLYYVNNKGEAKEIANNAYDLEITCEDYALFLVDRDSEGNGTLYASINGGEKTKIADDVYNVYAGSTYSSYIVRSGDKRVCYIATSGISFKEAYSLGK